MRILSNGRCVGDRRGYSTVAVPCLSDCFDRCLQCIQVDHETNTFNKHKLQTTKYISISLCSNMSETPKPLLICNQSTLEQAIQFLNGQNDEADSVRETHLHLYDRDFFSGPVVTMVLNALQNATKARLTQVWCDCTIFFDLEEDPAKQAFADMILNSPHLCTFGWMKIGRITSTIAKGIHAATAFLRRARESAIVFVFYGIAFDGTEQDFVEFGRALEGCIKIKGIAFTNCTIDEESTANKAQVVLQALSNLSVELTHLDCWTPHGPNETFSTICNNTKDLTLPSRGLLYANDALRNTIRLEHLTVEEFCFREAECRQLGDVVRDHESILALSVLSDVREGHQNLDYLVEPLKQNTKLTQLYVSFIGEASSFDEPFQAKMVSMMESNLTMLHVELRRHGDLIESDATKVMKFYGQLNKLGRKNFVDPNTSKVKQMVILESVKDDVNALFHFLSLQPTLCDLSGGQVSSLLGNVPSLESSPIRRLESLNWPNRTQKHPNET